MAVRPFSLGFGSRSSRRPVAVLVVSILLATALGGLPIAAVTAGATTTAHDTSTESPAPVASDDVVIDETLPENGTIEVVVRLEDAPIPESMPEDDVESELEAHADDTQDPLLDHAAETAGITVEAEFWLTNAVLLTVDTDRVDLDSIAAFDAVERVHENFVIPHPELAAATTSTTGTAESETTTASTIDAAESETATPSTIDAGSGTTTQQTWGIDQLNAPAVWDEYGTRGEGVRVAVLDTGVDPTHPDIDLHTTNPSDPTYPGGWVEFDETGERVANSKPHDTGIHGTHVSGTIAGGNASGIQIGVAPEVELLHGLVLSETGGSFAQVVAGIEWAVANDADVASMSLGVSGTYQAFVDPVHHARDSGTIVVGAIGNDGYGNSSSPGNVYEALSVGAVDVDGTVPEFSGGKRVNRTDWTTPPATWPDTYAVPDFVAPGVAIMSAVPGGAYRQLPGTSMATPHVAGTIALLLSIEPAATPNEITTAVTETVWNPDAASVDARIDRETRYGNGIVDAKAAADAIVGDRSNASSATVSDGDGGQTADASSPLSLRIVGLVIAIGIIAMLVALGLPRLDSQ